MSSHMSHSVLLGFDFGTKKIGIAVGQVITGVATPLSIIKAENGKPSWQVIEDLIKKWKVEAFVVGIPYNMDGSEQNTTAMAKKFANRLADRFKLPTYHVDERLTTVEARQALFDSMKHSKIKPGDIDCYAAKLILESWFEDQRDIQNET